MKTLVSDKEQEGEFQSVQRKVLLILKTEWFDFKELFLDATFKFYEHLKFYSYYLSEERRMERAKTFITRAIDLTSHSCWSRIEC